MPVGPICRSVCTANSESGTYTYFKEHAFGKGDFKDSVKQQPGSAGVVQAVGKDRYGIGYSGIGYRTLDVPARCRWPRPRTTKWWSRPSRTP